MRLSLAIIVAFAPLAPWAAAQATGQATGQATAQATAQAPAQSSSAKAPATPNAPATPSPATTTSSVKATPTMAFQPPGTMTACQTNLIYWTVGDAPQPASNYKVEIHAFNMGVDQTIPSPATSSPAAASPTSPASSASRAPASPSAPAPPTAAVATPSTPANSGTRGGNAAVTAAVARDLTYQPAIVNLVARADYNVTVVKDWSAVQPASWVPKLPKGRYQLVGVSTDGIFGYSEPFTIVEGSDRSCLTSNGTSSSAKVPASSGTGSAARPTQSAGGSTGKEGQSTETKKSSISGGAIAGIVIGVLAALIIAALLFFCCRRRNTKQERPLIGSPQNFRKGTTKRASRFGLALSALGMGHGGNGTNNSGEGSPGSSAAYSKEFDVEKATPPLPGAATSAAARAPVSGRTSAMSGESENPFQTAPSTPVEETNMNLGGAPVAAAAAGTITPPSRAYNADPLFPPPNRPSSMPMTASGRSSANMYDHEIEGDDYRLSGSTMAQHKNTLSHDSGPQPMPSLPQTPASPYTPGGMGMSPTYSNPRYSQATSVASGHKSTKSTSSALDAVLAAAPAVPEVPSSLPRSSPPATSPTATSQPPSSYQSTNSPSSPRIPERKNSLRRKPVPKLNAEDESRSETRSSPQSSPRGSDDRGQPPIPLGPPGDQFGLSAALAGAGLDRGLSFKLMPDPPLPQHD